MIIWRGWGVLVAALVFGCSLAANFICNSVFGPTYYDQHKWPFAISLMVSAVICLVWGLWLRKNPGRVVVDKATGQEMVLRPPQPALFFIPVLYWSPILFVIALIVLVMDLVK